MRQIYTSPRQANIERVVALMTEHGIETTISNRRAYQGSDWKRFSYTAKGDRDSWPQVWVVRSEDQTRARQVLRDAGLEPATRFADELAAARGAGDTSRHKQASMRVKLVVFALIAGVIALIALTSISR
ncbi:MAG TPA: DUF2007 domain-containing protein [Rhodanobacteraceae bacterium]|jgi:hypothetical protein|nr:DUF2007 domain-containing protein [Rhodanobacteraceae bacterium]